MWIGPIPSLGRNKKKERVSEWEGGGREKKRKKKWGDSSSKGS